MEKNLDITKPHYSEQISPVPWPFLKSSFHCTGISRRKVVKKSARDNPDRYCVWFWPSVPLFFSPLVLYKKSFFFLVGYAILKELSYLFGAKFTCRKFYRWRHDNWPIEQSQHMSIIFFSAWIYKWFKSFLAKQVDLKTSSLARSLCDLMHWTLLRSFSRTYEKLTCSKSTSPYKRGIIKIK